MFQGCVPWLFSRSLHSVGYSFEPTPPLYTDFRTLLYLILLYHLDKTILSKYFRKSLLANPFWLRKITTDPHILVHVNVEYRDDRDPKLKIYISELILDSYEYIPVAYITMYLHDFIN